MTPAEYALHARELLDVYTALEDAAVALAGDPQVGPLLLAGLRRRTALLTDLEHFHGPHWRSELEYTRPLPATRRYAERIRAVAPASPEHYVAHALVRCLADLSAAEHAGRQAAEILGVERGAPGVAFYAYDGPDALRAQFQRLVDAVPWTEVQRRDLRDELRVARRLSREQDAELSRARRRMPTA
ncbi:hypothetical protein GCM10009839_84320 [Catenulispora yoronensis]|uniref:Uncharacterized protein n=1 Tax=Catenulispora yoronensis TaxID=450799 RepID=A0ABN2VEP8_9ACTN